jgi:hypothetical protein
VTAVSQRQFRGRGSDTAVVSLALLIAGMLSTVDIALIAALRGAGLASPDAVGAVLLYRIITFKILVTLLWIGYRNLHDRRSPA